MGKIAWIDTETTGINFKDSAILQLAVLIEIDKKIVEEFSINMQPHEDATIAPAALRVHGITHVQWEHFDLPTIGLHKLRQQLGKHVNKYNKNDKFVVAGYNVNFDVQMLRSIFLRDGDKFFGSWFFWPVIDVQTYVAEAIISQNLNLVNYKLGTVCKHYGIDIEAHEALSDITATRNLYKHLKGV